MSKGNIVQVSGPVIDVEFKGTRVPKLREALTVKVGNETRTMEVAQLLGAGDR